MQRGALALSLQDVIAMCADVAMKFLHKSSEPITGLDTSGGHSQAMKGDKPSASPTCLHAHSTCL